MNDLTQRAADWIQARTGLSCHQQSAATHGAALALAAAAFLQQVLTRTASVPTLPGTAGWLAFAILILAARRLMRANRVGEAARLAVMAFLLLKLLVNWSLAIGMALWTCQGLGGLPCGLPTEAWLACAVMQVSAARWGLRQHRQAMADFEAGRFPAPPAGLRPPASLAWVAAAAAVTVATWPALAPALTAACWTAHVAGELLGRCRPRPPSSRRGQARQAWAGAPRAA